MQVAKALDRDRRDCKSRLSWLKDNKSEMFDCKPGPIVPKEKQVSVLTKDEEALLKTYVNPIGWYGLGLVRYPQVQIPALNMVAMAKRALGACPERA